MVTNGQRGEAITKTTRAALARAQSREPVAVLEQPVKQHLESRSSAKVVGYAPGKIGIEISDAILDETTIGVLRDKPNKRILECAVAAKSEYIVSEDKDLIRLGEFRGIKVVTMAVFLEWLA